MIGRTISHYRVLERLSAGGMGVVYKAEDTKLGRLVALKFLSEKGAGSSRPGIPERSSAADEPGGVPTPPAYSAEALERFRLEARAASALNHPNICTIYDIDEHEGHPFIVMELLEGQTLKRRIAEGPFSTDQFLDLAIQIAGGLDTAHSNNIVHRDLKPANIFITARGQAKILDFGLVKLAPRRVLGPAAPEPPSAPPGGPAEASKPAGLTRLGTTAGTIGYMSPEQVRGEPLDARTDLFSFGTILYEMATGQQAFSSNTTAMITSFVLAEAPVFAGRLNPHLPAKLEEIISRALEMDRNLRYQTASDMEADLKRLRRDTGSGPQPAAGSAFRTATGRHSGRRLTKIHVALILFAAAALVAVISGLLKKGGSAGTIHSIAVLPFSNVTADPDTNYLSDGITESVIDNLSQIPALRVMARSTVFRFKGKDTDAQQVGRELNVGAVLTGSLTRHGNDLTITTDLVRVSDGTEMWGHRYEQKMSDTQDVVDGIARQISDRLRLSLTPDERLKLAKRQTVNPQAYQLYLQGLFYWNKRTPDDLRKSIDYFQRAIAEDPNYALAYAGLANVLNVIDEYVDRPTSEFVPQAEVAAQKALQLDDSLAEAHTALGNARANYDWDWAGGRHEFQRAIQLNPNDANAHYFYAECYLAATGRYREAIQEFQRALELDPLSPIMNANLGVAYYYAEDYDRAIQQELKTLKMFPDFWVANEGLIAAYEMKGQYSEAIAARMKLPAGGYPYKPDPQELAALKKALAEHGAKGYWQESLKILKDRSTKFYLSPIYFARHYAMAGDKTQAFQWLQKAVAQKDSLTTWIMAEPNYDSLRSDPRFREILRQMNFPPQSLALARPPHAD
jgi:eukaryotic-like serine/threonine-protein kinase